ncbi:hypothetical protein RJT34_19775 [Clitoria ternatea]|uniref:Uncharacterized protein n=1 Tax=Clitoria ternatea TaxID=43366 RepID=A0AAN9P514_CLITE
MRHFFLFSLGQEYPRLLPVLVCFDNSGMWKRLAHRRKRKNKRAKRKRKMRRRIVMIMEKGESRNTTNIIASYYYN